MKKIYKTFREYISNTDGVVTIEWVGIAAVVFIAAIAISAFILQSADGLGGAVAGQMDNAAAQIDGTAP